MKYKYPKGVDVISGMGGGYEATCQKMVIAGVEWCDNNKDKNPTFKQYKNIYGITADENKDMEELQNVMLKASGNDCTGAMMQATTNHVLYIKKNGWDKYLKEVLKQE